TLNLLHILKNLHTFLDKAAITVLSLLTAGCSSGNNDINTEQNAVTYVENEDYQYFIDSSSAFAKVDNGYYFLNDLILYFFDCEAREAYIVCDKPNCTHNSSDCTAYFNIFSYYPFQLSHYNNSLYVLGWEEENNIRRNYIYEISLDNYKRKKSAYLFDGADTSSVSFIIHRGYVYYLKGSTDELKETASYLYRKKLGSTNKKENAEKIYETSGIGASIIDIKASGNNIIVLNSSYGDTDGNDYKTSYTLIDIHSLKTKELADNDAYSLFADGEYAYYEKDENTVYRIDINTYEETFFCEADSLAYISADNNYIYFDNLQSIYIGKTGENDRKISIYNKSGKHITDIIPKNPKGDCYFGGDDIMIFKEKITGEIVTDSDTQKLPTAIMYFTNRS
ncbi:MAG: DUF5050 domain-containing protein, partial [Clostridiales bacterium]|nr:DUF5050 domain-containing protein [Clostridiales bacterium]